MAGIDLLMKGCFVPSGLTRIDPVESHLACDRRVAVPTVLCLLLLQEEALIISPGVWRCLFLQSGAPPLLAYVLRDPGLNRKALGLLYQSCVPLRHVKALIHDALLLKDRISLNRNLCFQPPAFSGPVTPILCTKSPHLIRQNEAMEGVQERWSRASSRKPQVFQKLLEGHNLFPSTFPLCSHHWLSDRIFFPWAALSSYCSGLAKPHTFPQELFLSDVLCCLDL